VGAVVLDSGVVIGLLDARDAPPRRCRRGLRERADEILVLPVSAYAEVLAGSARIGQLEAARDRVRALGLRVDALESRSTEAAAVLRGRFASLRLPDALVLGHAEAIGADLVLTTDRRWRRVAAKVAVVG
jgi:predicted nucleic acid-binding protein